MVDSDIPGGDLVNVFEVDGYYLLKHYFEGDDVFRRLRKYYNNHRYRFEIPNQDYADIERFLHEKGYRLSTVDNTEAFAVAVKKYTAHPDNIFKDSVIERSVSNYNCFLMKNHVAVKRAANDGAVRLEETSLENPF